MEKLSKYIIEEYLTEPNKKGNRRIRYNFRHSIFDSNSDKYYNIHIIKNITREELYKELKRRLK